MQSRINYPKQNTKFSQFQKDSLTQFNNFYKSNSKSQNMSLKANIVNSIDGKKESPEILKNFSTYYNNSLVSFENYGKAYVNTISNDIVSAYAAHTYKGIVRYFNFY